MNLRIKFRSENIDQFIERYAIDVSRGGIFIRTREPLAVGTQLKFDFQLQDGAPMMAGEGTVVWIREHDPTRTGVTPGMGVRFDKLTPASQPVLDRILSDKGHREQSGLSMPGTSSKLGAGIAVRRPSSTFSAVDPAVLPAILQAASPAGSGPVAAPTGSTLPFGSSSPQMPVDLPQGGARSSATAPGHTAATLDRRYPAKDLAPASAAPPPTPGSGAGALPTLETQSPLGRMTTGASVVPNPISAGGSPGGARTTGAMGKYPPPLADSSAPKSQMGSRASTSSGVPAVPTSIEDSERTQIADAFPGDFSNEPTRVGGPALPVTPSRYSTPMPIASEQKPKLSLDHSVSSIDVRAMSGGASSGASSGAGESSGPVVARTTTPARDRLPELPPKQMAATMVRDFAPGAAPGGAPSRPTAIVTPARPPAVGPKVQAASKKRPLRFIIAGVVTGVAIAAVIGTRMTGTSSDKEAAPEPAPVAAKPVTDQPKAPETPPPPAAAAAAQPTAANPAAAAEAPSENAKPPTAEAKSPVAEAKPPVAEAKSPEPTAPAIVPPAKSSATGSQAATSPEHEKAAPPAPAGHKHGGHKRTVASARKTEGAADSPAPAADAEGTDEAPAATAPAAPDATPGHVVKVTSTPGGAEVLFDGQSVGKTPYQGKDLDPATPHAVTVRKDGFETYAHMISGSDWNKIKGVQTLKIMVKLRKDHSAAPDSEAAKPASDKAADTSSDKPAAPAKAEAAKPEAPIIDSP